MITPAELRRTPLFSKLSDDELEHLARNVADGSVKRVAAGVGEGSMAIAMVHQLFARAESSTPRSVGGACLGGMRTIEPSGLRP